MVDKEFCMSSYLAFRYIEDDSRDFFADKHHENYTPVKEEDRIFVETSEDIGREIELQLKKLRGKKGILLSGGMDSAIIASYLSGAEAYTFRFLGGSINSDELRRAEYYANIYCLNLHYVDISWDTVENYLEKVMAEKAAPVHSIEPQILQAALMAKADGVDIMLVGESSDLVFGGMDKLLEKDWDYEEFVKRYTFTDPFGVLKNPVDMHYLFDRYRLDDNKIDFLSFMDDVFSIESSGSYYNAFKVAKMPYFDPYARLKMARKLDLARVRNGEPKYLIRELMKKRYPDIPIPEKVPMPRPVDEYFRDWEGPRRAEFREDIDIAKYTGNQKWQIWCLERFLDIYFGG